MALFLRWLFRRTLFPLKCALALGIFLGLQILDATSRFFDLKLIMGAKLSRESLQHACYISPHNDAMRCVIPLLDILLPDLTLPDLVFDLFYKEAVFYGNLIVLAIPIAPSAANIELAPFLDQVLHFLAYICLFRLGFNALKEVFSKCFPHVIADRIQLLLF